MPATDWINLNKNRLYPFQNTGAVTIDGVVLPRQLIGDAGFVLGIRSNAAPDAAVWLQQVVKSGNLWVLSFYYSPDGSGYSSYKFEFVLDGTEEEGTTMFVDAIPLTSGYGSQSSMGDEDEEYGSAFIVVGDLTSSTLADGVYVQTDGDSSRVLPALVQSLSGHFVRRIHLANDPGPEFIPCGQSETSQAALPVCRPAVVMRRDLMGDVKLMFGYNASVGMVTDDNRIVFGGGIGIGEGVPCQEVSRDPSGDTPNAQDCNDLLYMINGVSPGDDGGFVIQGGKGITVSSVDGSLAVIPDDQAFCTDLWGSVSG